MEHAGGTVGNGFRANPDDLKLVANGDLEAIITDYVEPAKEKVSSTAKYDGDAFKGSSEVAVVEAKWSEARDLLKRVLEDNTENLELSRRALVEIADRYIEADETVAAHLRGIEGLY